MHSTPNKRGKLKTHTDHDSAQHVDQTLHTTTDFLQLNHDSLSSDSDSSETLPQFMSPTERRHLVDRRAKKKVQQHCMNTTFTYLSDHNGADNNNESYSPGNDDNEQCCGDDDTICDFENSESFEGKCDASCDGTFADNIVVENNSEFVESEAKHSIPLQNGDFLSVAECISIFRKGEVTCDEIPTGVKNNVYFVVRDEKNLSRSNKREKRQYWDDCGAWVSGTIPSSYYRQRIDGSWQQLRFSKNRFCVNTKSGYIALDPQPHIDDIITIQ